MEGEMNAIKETGWYWYRRPNEVEGVLVWVHGRMAWNLMLGKKSEYDVTAHGHMVDIMIGDWIGPLTDPFAGKPNDRTDYSPE